MYMNLYWEAMNGKEGDRPTKRLGLQSSESPGPRDMQLLASHAQILQDPLIALRVLIAND